MAKLCLAICFLSSSLFAAVDPEWENAVQLLESGKAAEAIPLFEAWTANAQASGQDSPEAWHNLALAYLNSNQHGLATYPLATSSLLRLNPFYGWSVTSDISRIQHQLLIQDSVASHWPYRLFVLIRPAGLWILGTIGIWICLFSVFARGLRRPVFQMGVWVLVFVGIGVFVRRSLPPFGVVVGGPAGTTLNSEPVLGTDKKLAELPVGTLVVLGPTQDHSISISAPFAGWLPASSIRPLTNQ